MVAVQYQRGHAIYYNKIKEEWLYLDDDSSASIERPCVRCGHMPLASGNDYCLGHLEGVKAACCGHGVEDGYRLYNNNVRKNFENKKPLIKKTRHNEMYLSNLAVQVPREIKKELEIMRRRYNVTNSDIVRGILLDYFDIHSFKKPK